ncbi:hypothetical protein EMIT0P253_220060 [Pseudomonas sp. IT-P253]
MSKNPTFRESAELSLRSVTELFARFACHVSHDGNPSGHGARLDSPFLRFTSSKEREKNGFSQLHKSVASK